MMASNLRLIKKTLTMALLLECWTWKLKNCVERQEINYGTDLSSRRISKPPINRIVLQNYKSWLFSSQGANLLMSNTLPEIPTNWSLNTLKIQSFRTNSTLRGSKTWRRPSSKEEIWSINSSISNLRRVPKLQRRENSTHLQTNTPARLSVIHWTIPIDPINMPERQTSMMVVFLKRRRKEKER